MLAIPIKARQDEHGFCPNRLDARTRDRDSRFACERERYGFPDDRAGLVVLARKLRDRQMTNGQIHGCGRFANSILLGSVCIHTPYVFTFSSHDLQVISHEVSTSC